MTPYHLNQTTLAKIRELIEANFAVRDELYAAAESLDDEARKKVCRRLADHLGGHAAELQQILLSTNSDVVDVADVDFVDYIAEQTFLTMVRELHGSARVIAAVEQSERNLKGKYDEALQSVPEREAEGVLERQRSDVEFGEQVLHCMQDNPDVKPRNAENSERK